MGKDGSLVYILFLCGFRDGSGTERRVRFEKSLCRFLKDSYAAIPNYRIVTLFMSLFLIPTALDVLMASSRCRLV